MEKLFQLRAHGSDVRTEFRAGVATFLTMSYIIVVNPGILADAGMPFAGVLFATVMVSALGSILMGVVANLPFAIAPGMGINAFFSYTIVLGMGVPWETALGAVFVSGVIFVILTLLRVREKIVAAIPAAIRYAVAAGIGVLLALIGLTAVDFIVHEPATIVGFGGLSLEVLLFLMGLFLTALLIIKRVKGALVIGIVAMSLLAAAVSATLTASGGEPLVDAPESVFALPSFEVFFKLDIVGVMAVGMIAPVFTLLFTDMFDSISTLVGVSQAGGFIDERTGTPKNVGRALLVDALATTSSGLFGSSSGTAYIESAAGVEEGGRTGLTAVFAGILFLPFIFLSPLLALVPAVATAPVLVIVGLYMMAPLVKVKWADFEEAIPAFLAFILIPLTYNISQGILWGFLSYTIIKLLVGKAHEIGLTLWLVSAACVIALLVA